MLESEVENYLVYRVETLKGEIRKLKWIGRRGAPDRLVLLNGAHFVELKRPKKDAEAHQAREHKRMRDRGASVYLLSDKVQVDWFLEKIMK